MLYTLNREGGIGLKKFSLVNQAMLAKQFWRISHNPQSLVAKTFKAEYFPDVPYITVSLNPTTLGFGRTSSGRKIQSFERADGWLEKNWRFPLITLISSNVLKGCLLSIKHFFVPWPWLIKEGFVFRVVS